MSLLCSPLHLYATHRTAGYCREYAYRQSPEGYARLLCVRFHHAPLICSNRYETADIAEITEVSMCDRDYRAVSRFIELAEGKREPNGQEERPESMPKMLAETIMACPNWDSNLGSDARTAIRKAAGVY